ncbi:hypothetical protein [Paenibacillus sp. L3-i20]|uniref:hypothetical protein n=1 Tax=Paenibacillus sp. L3-i20 TaxID=2905833 RepID=UPI001EDEC39E|nr:hypothetical protein [Paenibacillus sp. L3-i20]GKU79486.1 hypothetical protein L3i20_v238830 [Paenibacillus sp. L3-i20]
MTSKLMKKIVVLIAAMIMIPLISCNVFAAAPTGESSTGNNDALGPVQVFDVSAGKVVKTIPNDKKIQRMAAKWTNSVSGLSPQATTDHGCTYVYRIPLAKPAQISTGEINVTTTNLFLFYCKDKSPFLLVFDLQNKPYLFLFKENIKPFIKKVGLPENPN